jgi:uncharacterized membrane protein YeaQ/YmgE (transglycosylase-associated protein family)
LSLIMYLIAGAGVGYIASRIMRTNSQLGLLVYIIEGSVGAFLADCFISPLLNIGTIDAAVTIPTLLVILAGSLAMILIVEAVHHRDTDERSVLYSGQTNRGG